LVNLQKIAKNLKKINQLLCIFHKSNPFSCLGLEKLPGSIYKDFRAIRYTVNLLPNSTKNKIQGRKEEEEKHTVYQNRSLFFSFLYYIFEVFYPKNFSFPKRNDKEKGGLFLRLSFSFLDSSFLKFIKMFYLNMFLYKYIYI